MAVDRAVLDRGCDFLKAELRKDRPTPRRATRAWLAVALAGRARPVALQVFARRIVQQNCVARGAANLALACRWAGLNEEAERLWATVRGWQPDGTERLALKLNVQIVFGAPFEDCRQTCRRLLALRTGHRWAHTRDTSWAIEALANMLTYVPEQSPVRRVRITVGGKAVLDIADPDRAEEARLSCRLLGRASAGRRAALEIVLAADCDEPMRYAIQAVGMQRLDRLEPEGQRIQLRRSHRNPGGQAADRAVEGRSGRRGAAGGGAGAGRAVRDRRGPAPGRLRVCRRAPYRPLGTAAAHTEYPRRSDLRLLPVTAGRTA